MKMVKRMNEKLVNRIAEVRLRGVAEIIWQQTAMESGEAVRRVHCSQ